MSTVYELSRSGPEREEGIRQLIANLQQQNRQLMTDRDRYAEWLVEERSAAAALRADRVNLTSMLRALWDAYIPDCAPAAALSPDADLHPAWKPIAEYLME